MCKTEQQQIIREIMNVYVGQRVPMNPPLNQAIHNALEAYNNRCVDELAKFIDDIPETTRINTLAKPCYSQTKEKKLSTV